MLCYKPVPKSPNKVNLLIDDPKDIGSGNGWESRAMTNADSGVVVP